jgi:protein phosphatase
MLIIPGNAQNIGSRKEQQDDFGFSDIANNNMISHAGVLALLTDGMGGLSLGREAGQLAKITMLREYEKKSADESIPQALERSLTAANMAVLHLAQEAGLEEEIGTTLVAAVIKNHELFWISVGDSRLYLLRDGRLHQLNADHNYAQRLTQMVMAGTISQEDAENHIDRKALTSYLGLEQLTEVDQNTSPFPLESEDRILLCSDGLYGTLSEEEIAKLLLKAPQEAADDLVNRALAKKKPNQDNVTVAILALEDEKAGVEWSNWAGIKNNFIRVGLAILAISIVATGVWWGKKYLQNRGHASRQVVPQLQETIQENEKKPLPKVEEPERPPLTGSKSQLVVEPQPAEPVKKNNFRKKRKKGVKHRKTITSS